MRSFAGIIDEWRRQGNLTHLVISLRNLVELFARVGAIEAAGELLGALQPTSVTAAYGAEAQRLAQVAGTLERTVDQRAVARAVARGRRHDLRGATNLALAAIATLAQAEPTQDNGKPR